MRGVTWRAVPAKFKRGMCEIKILGSKILWCVFGTLVQDGLAHMRGVICSELFRQSSKQGCEMKIFGLNFVVCLGTLVQDGLAHTWRAVPAKFKTGIYEIKILGSEVLWCIFLERWFRVGTHAWCNMESCSGKVQKRDV